MGLTTSYSKAETDIKLNRLKQLFGSGLHDKPLKISDPTPTEPGGYVLADVGDYSFGNAPNGSYNVAFLSGTVWEIVSVSMPEGEKITDWEAKNYQEKSLVLSNNLTYRVADGKTAAAGDAPSKFSKVWIETGFSNSKSLGTKSFQNYKDLTAEKGSSFIGKQLDLSYEGNKLAQRDGTTENVGGSGYLITLTDFPAVAPSVNFNGDAKFIIYLNSFDQAVEIVDFDNQLNENFVIPKITGATKAIFTAVNIPTINGFLDLPKFEKSKTSRINLLQNRELKMYADLDYPNLHPTNYAAVEYSLRVPNGEKKTNTFFRDSNVYERTSNVIDAGETVRIGYSNNINEDRDSYVQFVVRFNRTIDRNLTGLIFQNASGETRRFDFNGNLNGNYGGMSTDFVDVKIVNSRLEGNYIYQTWQLKWEIRTARTQSRDFSIGNYSEPTITLTTQIGDIIIDIEPIDANCSYVDKPTFNRSGWIGKNIMVFGDSQMRDLIMRKLMEELGCNVFVNADGGRSMKWRNTGTTNGDQACLYHWVRRSYVKNLHSQGVEIHGFIFQVSYNDNSGGGELTYPKILAVENNSPLMSDDDAVIDAKNAIFDSLTIAEKEEIFGFRQTFAAYLKQLIQLYPEAYFQLCKVMYNPEGVGSTIDQQRDLSKPIRDSLNNQLEEIGGWFGIPVENISKSTRYYFGNMENYTTDTIHYNEEIAKRLGIGMAKSLLQIDFGS